jgi:hypothetical protein
MSAIAAAVGIWAINVCLVGAEQLKIVILYNKKQGQLRALE